MRRKLPTKADFERLRRLMEIAKKEVATWPAWMKGSPGNVRLDASENTTPVNQGKENA